MNSGRLWLRLHLLANLRDDGAAMRRDVIRFLRLAAFLDEEVFTRWHRLGAEIFCCPFPRLGASLQTIKKLAEVEVIQLDTVDERHNLAILPGQERERWQALSRFVRRREPGTLLACQRGDDGQAMSCSLP